jgi:menaquinone-dependent protoporphyrinogen oxidase
MMTKILVTYASRSGSTAGVAEAIARTLAESGAEVEVRAMKDVTDMSSYRAVVVGSAIQGGKWLPEAMKFVREHQRDLAQKRVATFMVCITLSMTNSDQYRDGLRDWLAPVRSLLHPVGEGMFAGTLDFRKVPFSFNALMMRLPVLFGLWKVGDHRDWNAIRTWSESLRLLLT